MGDIMELTILPGQRHMFYKVTSSAISFELKCFGAAAVGLSEKPNVPCSYWVVLGTSGQCYIRKADGNFKPVVVPNLVSPDTFKKFWITWNSESICLGRGGETTPFVSTQCSIPLLKYATFSVMRGRQPIHWKVELSPIYRTLRPLKPISKGKLRWVTPDDQLPEDALIGGFENELLYIIRAKHNNSLTPGKFVPSLETGFIAWGGEAQEKSEFEVLCGIDCKWVPATCDRIPVRAMEAGHSEVDREVLYLGRAWHEENLIPGKVQLSHQVCYIPYKGKEVAVKNFDILVEPERNLHSCNKKFIPNLPLNPVPIPPREISRQNVVPVVPRPQYSDGEDSEDQSEYEQEDFE